jgi:hypothetical protein
MRFSGMLPCRYVAVRASCVSVLNILLFPNKSMSESGFSPRRFRHCVM